MLPRIVQSPTRIVQSPIIGLAMISASAGSVRPPSLDTDTCSAVLPSSCPCRSYSKPHHSFFKSCFNRFSSIIFKFHYETHSTFIWTTPKLFLIRVSFISAIFISLQIFISAAGQPPKSICDPIAIGTKGEPSGSMSNIIAKVYILTAMFQRFKCQNIHIIKCDNMKLSDNQKRAIKEIERITEHFGIDRWFIQAEVVGAGYKTMMALVNKGYLKTKYFGSMDYYQVVT